MVAASNSSQSRTQRHDWYSSVVDAITSAHCYIQSLHWLRVVERITFRLAVLTYRCLHRSAPEYLSRQLQQVSEVCTRRRLRSSSSTALVISRTDRATIGGRAFSAAATSVWNSLPEAVRSSASLALFRKSLKTELYARSCSD